MGENIYSGVPERKLVRKIGRTGQKNRAQISPNFFGKGAKATSQGSKTRRLEKSGFKDTSF